MSISGHPSWRKGANFASFREPSKTNSDLVTIQGCSTTGLLRRRMRQAHLALPWCPEMVGAKRKALRGFAVVPTSESCRAHTQACSRFAELGLYGRICPVVFVAQGNCVSNNAHTHSAFIKKQCLKERFDVYVLNTVCSPNWSHPRLGDR